MCNGPLRWTMHCLEVLVEHHNNGDHAQNGWKPHVYNNAIKAVRDKCEVDVTKQKIVSRCKTFDKHYEILSKIFAQSGFGWDWEKNMLSIDSEDVWDKYVEANEKATIYKNKVVHNWNEISIIYSKDKANGEGARTNNESEVVPPPQENDMSPEFVEPAPKRQRASEALLCMVGEMKTSFNDALKTTDPLAIPQSTPPSDILAELNMIAGLSRVDKLRSYSRLILSERKFRALMDLPMDERKDWLLLMLADVV